MLRPSLYNSSRDLFDDFFNFPFFDDKDFKKMEKKLYGRRGKNLMKTDVKEKADSYEVIMDLPGFKKDEIQVSLENGYLTVSAEKGLEEDKKEKFLRRERYAGACERSFYVGNDITRDDIKGEFRHGVLILTIPKNPENVLEDSKYITIE